MKRALSVFSLVILMNFFCSTLPFASAEQSEETGFSFGNGITFGMAYDDVVEHHGRDLLLRGGEDFIISETMLSAGCNSFINYYFDKDRKLGEIVIVYSEEHEDNSGYIDDFERVDKALHTKYGTPVSYNVYSWRNNDYMSETDINYGDAIGCGDLHIASQWNLPDGTILFHTIWGRDEFGISHSTVYVAPKEREPINTDWI